MDLDTKFVKSTVVLDDWTTDFAYYDFSSEYDEIQNVVDVSMDTVYDDRNIIVSALLTNGKADSVNVMGDEESIVNLYNSLMANKGEGLKIRQNGTEYSFDVENRQSTPTTNIAYSTAIDGTAQYEKIGNPENRWSFSIYIDTIPKYNFIQNLAVNPIADIYIDEYNDYKTALITNVSITRITTGKYNAGLELVILWNHYR